jgi:hypothetical protein
MQDKFLVYEQQPTMAMDCLRSTHSVSSRVDNPSQISEVFDSISYSKGKSSVTYRSCMGERVIGNWGTETTVRTFMKKFLLKREAVASISTVLGTKQLSKITF